MFTGTGIILLIVTVAIHVTFAIIVTVTTRVITIKTITAVAAIIKNIIPNTETGALTNITTKRALSATLTAVIPHLAAGEFLTGRGQPRLEGSMGAFSVSFWIQGSEFRDFSFQVSAIK
jgi:hypothetical protein